MKKLVILIVIGLLGLISNVPYSQATCPPGEDCPDESVSTFPPNGPWTDGGCVGVTIQWTPQVVCHYMVCFCYRVTGVAAPYIEIFFKCVQSTSQCSGYIPTPEQLRYELTKGIINANYQVLEWNIPPCEDYNDGTEFHVYEAACKYEGQPCPNSGAYCSQKYYACILQSGEVELTPDGSPTILGSCIDQDCGPECD